MRAAADAQIDAWPLNEPFPLMPSMQALTLRVRRGLDQTCHSRLAVGGGVAANGPLREAMGALGVELDIPPMSLCTDNAAMIASAARFSTRLAFPDYLAKDVYATGEPRRMAA